MPKYLINIFLWSSYFFAVFQCACTLTAGFQTIVAGLPGSDGLSANSEVRDPHNYLVAWMMRSRMFVCDNAVSSETERRIVHGIGCNGKATRR